MPQDSFVLICLYRNVSLLYLHPDGLLKQLPSIPIHVASPQFYCQMKPFYTRNHDRICSHVHQETPVRQKFLVTLAPIALMQLHNHLVIKAFVFTHFSSDISTKMP
jgi:hypothetical protein